MLKGDLVTLVEGAEGILMHHRWNEEAADHPTAFSRFHSHELGVVLESLESQGGNGCRVIVTGKKMRVGWVNSDMLRIIQPV